MHTFLAQIRAGFRYKHQPVLAQDVWWLSAAADGGWTRATAAAAWSPRYRFAAVAHGGNIWVMGGIAAARPGSAAAGGGGGAGDQRRVGDGVAGRRRLEHRGRRRGRRQWERGDVVGAAGAGGPVLRGQPVGPRRRRHRLTPPLAPSRAHAAAHAHLR